MELQVCILIKENGCYEQCLHRTITESDLFDWAKCYIADTYCENTEAISIEVESIKM